MAEAADFFLRTPTLTASNFAALWPTDPKFLALKYLLFFSQCSEFQSAGSILKVGFALSKWPHFNRAYLVTMCKQKLVAVTLKIVLILWIIKSFKNIQNFQEHSIFNYSKFTWMFWIVKSLKIWRIFPILKNFRFLENDQLFKECAKFEGIRNILKDIH